MEPRLEHRNYPIRRVIDEYRNGRLVIPEFQRDYVWKPSRAPKLLDSLYHGYPISSLLIWESAGDVKTRRKDPRPVPGGRTSWLIDGQQRVITLARCMTGDQGIDVVFHLRDHEFKRANAATRQDPDWVRVTDIWEDEGFRRLRRNLENDRHEGALERVRRILEYEIPAVHMVDHGFTDAVEAFKRVNTLGVKLKKQDIESAEVAAKHSGFIRDHVAPKIAELRQQGFDRLDVTHLFRACAFVAHPDGRRRTPLHELTSREVTQAWKKTLAGLDSAMGLVGSELGLVNMKVLWSGSLLVPPIILCATRGPRERNDGEIAGWVALASLLHRYSGSSETALDQDIRACRADDPIRALLRNLRASREHLSATERDFQGGLADKSGLLAVYIACKQRGVTDLFTERKVVLQEQIDRHHILPRALFEREQRARADNLANISFVSGEANRAVAAAPPDVYLAEVKARVLKTQCIPEDRRFWRIDRADEFWAERRSLLAEAFNEFLGDALPNRNQVG